MQHALPKAARHTLGIFALLTAAACGSDGGSGPGTTPPPPPPPPPPEATGTIVPLDVFAAAGGTPGAACATAQHRQFDFWLGNWNIATPSGQPAGVSIVSTQLAGCAITEFYQGGAGQSLNVYDPVADAWNQFYLFSGPGILLLRGGLVNGEMVLAEQRTPSVRDQWTWSAASADTVWQRERLTIDGVERPGFEGRYGRRASAPPKPAVGGPGCAASALAFIVGTWQVYEGDPSASGTYRGQLQATSEALGCALIERLSGAAGFAALSFGAFHPALGVLLREYADTDGRYVRFSGGAEGSRVVLTGTRRATDGTDATVRVTWEPVSSREFRQSWELSRDGGATRSALRSYRFIRDE